MGLSDEIKSIFRKKSNTKTKTIKKFQGPTRPTTNVQKFRSSGISSSKKFQGPTRPTTNVQKFRSSGRSHGGGGSSLNVKNFIKSGGTKTTPKEVLTNFQNDLKNNKVKLSSESKPKRINLPKPNQIQPANSEPNKFVKISFASAFSQSAKNLGRRFVNTNPYKIPPLGDTLRPFDYMVDPVFARKSPAFTTPKFGTIGLKESPFRSYGESTIGKRAQQLNFERGFPLPSNLGERKSKAGEVVKFAAFSNPLTSAILTKTEIDKEKKVIGKKGVINPKTSSGTVFASLGIIPFGSLGRIKKLERSVAFSPLKSLEKEPFSTGQVLKLKDGSGSFSLSGERSFGGFKEKITMKGKINKVGKNSFFIPRGKGSSKITGKLNTNLLGGKKPTQFLSTSEFIVGSKGFSVPLNKKASITFSKNVVIPKGSTSALFQFPSNLKQSEKLGGSIVKQSIKNFKKGGNKIISWDVSFSSKIGDNLFFTSTPKREGGLKDIGLTKFINKDIKSSGKDSFKNPIKRGTGKKIKPKTPFKFEANPIKKTKNLFKRGETKTLQKINPNIKTEIISPPKIISIKNPSKINLPKSSTSIIKRLGTGFRFGSGVGSITNTKFNQLSVFKQPTITTPKTNSKNIQKQLSTPKIISQISSRLKNLNQGFGFPSLSNSPRTPSPEIPRNKLSIKPFFPKFGLNIGKNPKGRNLGASRIFKYTPSFKAFVFNISGKKTKGIKIGGREAFTGFEVRPLTPKKTRKKTSKKRKKK